MERVYIAFTDGELERLLEESEARNLTVEQLLREAAGEWLEANRWRL